jgi:hypothetical protein
MEQKVENKNKFQIQEYVVWKYDMKFRDLKVKTSK